MRKYFLFIVFSLFLTCCGPADVISFDKPQPEGVKDLEQLPFFYRGQYMSLDSSILIIEKKYILRKSENYVFIGVYKDSIKNKYNLEKNFLVDKTTKERLQVKTYNDSIYLKQSSSDTVFYLSNDNVARKFKGFLILNYKYQDSWSVELLNLQWRTIKHFRISSKEVFNMLISISEGEVKMDSTNTDTLQMILKPTKKEFKKILKLQDSLVMIGEYKKI